MANKNRSELKSYFVKNAIPTEANFADLIDGSLNQVDDGVLKLPGEPLAVVSAGGAQQRVLRLFGSYPAANPDWMLSLNPGEPSQAGLGISDGATGALRLFVSKANGRVGIGTNTPQALLDVAGDVRSSGSLTVPTATVGTATLGKVTVQTDARVSGTLTVAGSRIYNAAGYAVLEMNQIDWLRINPENKFAGTAIYRSVAIGEGGLAIGSWETPGAGVLKVAGPATLFGGVNVANPNGIAHIDADGAFYRNTDGQVYITVDDLLYIRDSGAAAGVWAARFETDTGNLRLRGSLYTGASDIYFTSTEHTHSTIGNAQGWAAIENAKDYSALMILGRMVGTQRRVRLWDYLEVNGALDVTGSIKVNGNVSAGSGYLLLKGDREGIRGDDSWLRLNQAGAFTSGTHTPGLFAPMSINVAAAGGKWELNPGQGCIYAAGNIGSANWSPSGGGNFPSGWGGGLHTWDVVAEASIGYSALRQWSSIREKTNIEPFRNPLATLEQLNPTCFVKAGEERLGFIAEEVLEVFKLGAAGADDFFASGIAPDALLALAVAALQELSLKVRALESKGGKRTRPSTKGEEVARVVREGEHDGQRYVTVRFHGDEGRQVVRTLRIPPDSNRDDIVKAEHVAWLKRLAGEAPVGAD